MKKIDIFGIAGEKTASQVLVSAYNKTFSSFYNYFYYEYDFENYQIMQLPAPFTFRFCDCSDFDLLFSIQKKYLFEEVLNENEPFCESAYQKQFFEKLSQNRVLAIFFAEKAVAKIEINAESMNFVQLGGVWTSPDFRQKGLASFLILKLAEKVIKEKRKLVLFVKETNQKAINLYEKIGFTKIGNFFAMYR